jgi:hypothetical protein
MLPRRYPPYMVSFRAMSAAPGCRTRGALSPSDLDHHLDPRRLATAGSHLGFRPTSEPCSRFGAPHTLCSFTRTARWHLSWPSLPSGFHSPTALAVTPPPHGVRPLQGSSAVGDGTSARGGEPTLLEFLPYDLHFILGPGDPEGIDYLWDQTRLSPTVGTPLWDTHKGPTGVLKFRSFGSQFACLRIGEGHFDPQSSNQCLYQVRLNLSRLLS